MARQTSYVRECPISRDTRVACAGETSPCPAAGVTRLELVAVGWGGLVASIGLMAASSRDLPLRLLAVGATFLLGGFLAGVRSTSRRPLHGLAAGVAAHAIYVVFVALAALIATFAEPDPPDLVPD